MRTVAALALMLCVVWPGSAVTARSRRTVSTKTAKTAVRKTAHRSASTPGKSSTSAKPQSSHSRRGTSHTGKTVTARNRRGAPVKVVKQTWRTGQMAPTSDRYKEIQGALAAKGYAAGDADGVWGPAWTSSLKRFQQDQKLEPSGKLTSLSLITLGLGPRRETAETSTPAAAVPENPSSSSDSSTRELK